MGDTFMLRWLQRHWDRHRRVITPALSPPPPPAPPRQMIIYHKGLPSLPDDMIFEIFSLLDIDALKACSLTGKALSCSAKPFLHRTLCLTSRSGGSAKRNVPGHWSELEGLPTLGKRDLLQHTHHISIIADYSSPLFAYGLDPHTQHLRTLTNLRSLKARWLDIPSFIPMMEVYFEAFLETLQSLELECPTGNHKHILYFFCQFPNLRDLRIHRVQGCASSARNSGPRFDIRTSPPLDGTLDLQFGMSAGPRRDMMGVQHILSNIATFPSGLKFRTLKLSGCADDDIQPLVDACAPTLEYMEFIWEQFDAPLSPRLSFKRHHALRKLGINLGECANPESAAGWLSETLSTITSNAFTELTVSITLICFPSQTMNENLARGWGAIDDVLDQCSLREDVTLVARSLCWMWGSGFQDLIEKHFPLMWKNGRVVLEVPPHDPEDDLLVEAQLPPYYWLSVGM